MANYLYNGVELPEFPSALNSRTCFIYLSSTSNQYILYWFPSDVGLWKNANGRIMVTMQYSGRSYGTYKVVDGAWTVSNNYTCSSKNMEFTNIYEPIWTNKVIKWSYGESTYLEASTPVPAPEPELTSALEPASMLQGWFMGRKIARMRQR